MRILKIRFMIQVLRTLNLLIPNTYGIHGENEDLITDLEMALEEEK